jgi:preprotein translocase subunit SecF
MLDNVSTKYEEELAKAEASKAEAANQAALQANEKMGDTSESKEARTSKGLSLSVKQILSTLIALIIIFIVIFFQFKRHEKEYNKRVKDYKNEHKDDK